MHTDVEKSFLKEESGTYGSARKVHAKRNDPRLEDSAVVLSRIKYLMASAPCTASQAMDMLGISPLDRSRYLAKL